MGGLWHGQYVRRRSVLVDVEKERQEEAMFTAISPLTPFLLRHLVIALAPLSQHRPTTRLPTALAVLVYPLSLVLATVPPLLASARDPTMGQSSLVGCGKRKARRNTRRLTKKGSPCKVDLEMVRRSSDLSIGGLFLRRAYILRRKSGDWESYMEERRKSGDWESYMEEFRRDGKLSAWESIKVKEWHSPLVSSKRSYLARRTRSRYTANIFCLFLRFFPFGQVKVNARDGRSRHQSFRVCEVNLATLKVAISKLHDTMEALKT